MDHSSLVPGAPSIPEPGHFSGGSIVPHKIPEPIELRDADVEVTWETHCLHGHLRLYWDCFSKASLRLQFSPRNRLNFYMYIPPERIDKLSVCNPGLSDPEKYSLEFVLSRESYLLMPGSPASPWEPRDDISKKTLTLVHNLVKQKRFTLCVTTSGTHISLNSLRGLCKAMSEGKISTAADRVSHRIVDNGRGKVVEGDTMADEAGVATHSPDAPAPGYDDQYTALNSAPAYSNSSTTEVRDRKHRLESRAWSVESLDPEDTCKRHCRRSSVNPEAVRGSESSRPGWDLFAHVSGENPLAGQQLDVVGLFGIMAPLFTKLGQLSEAEARVAGQLDQLSAAEVRVAGQLGRLSEAEDRINETLQQQRLEEKVKSEWETEVLSVKENMRYRRLELRMEGLQDKYNQLQQSVSRDLAEVSSSLEGVHRELVNVDRREASETVEKDVEEVEGEASKEMLDVVLQVVSKEASREASRVVSQVVSRAIREAYSRLRRDDAAITED